MDQGRVTAKDARKILKDLVDRGRKQTSDVMKDLEQLVGRGATRSRTCWRTSRQGARASRQMKATAAYPRREGGPGAAERTR